MLKVLVNKCSIEILKTHYDLNKVLFINDGDIYKFLNGDAVFLGRSFGVLDIENIVDSIIKQKNDFPKDDIIVHTFNPLFLNFFTDEDAINYFEYYSKKTKQFEKFFKTERLLKKLKLMAPGDVVCDTDIGYL